MTQHHHDYRGDDSKAHDPDAELAEMLDLDGALHGSYLDEVLTWVGRLAPNTTRTVVDIGAGTGTGTLPLARRFPGAQVVAIDRSASMLERLAATAHAQGLTERLRVVQADLDVAWPMVGGLDLGWAASSLHHVADPDRLLREVHSAFNPGGLLVVTEMEARPRFLPDDIGQGRPGLEARCHEAMARARWNAHPNWRPHLELAGFEIAAEHTFDIELHPAPPGIEPYARAFLGRLRTALAGELAADDLDALDHLLADDGPQAVLRRRDLTLQGSRTAWAARRPDPAVS
jgi:SAM-dependent methyltransferase